MGSNLAITYEEVAAYQAEQGIALYDGNSGGYTTGGLYLSWTTEGGFSGTGWHNTNDSSSPANGYSDEEIRSEIEANGNLDTMFKNWTTNVDFRVRYDWLLNGPATNCVSEV